MNELYGTVESIYMSTITDLTCATLTFSPSHKADGAVDKMEDFPLT